MRNCVSAGLLAIVFLTPYVAGAADVDLSPLQQLGKEVFFDTTLSDPAGQSCASCHAPATGFTSPDSARNASAAIVAGAAPGRAGNRTPPSVAYAAYSPPLHWSKKDNSYVGGQFRDGRANDLAEQARGPFLNPLEMNNTDGAAVCRKVGQAPYARHFAAVFGGPLDCTADGFDRISRAVAAYEASPEVNPFTSKFDAVLSGKAHLTNQEQRGLTLYRGQAKCENCHPSKPGAHGEPPLFTDFTYDNIGTPRNSSNPFYDQARSVNPAGEAYIDPGLAGFLGRPSLRGKFKVPTLRNIAAGGDTFVRAYLHNGSLKSLKDVMDFYNSRDVAPHKWTAEEPRNMNHAELGNLRLTARDEEDVIAFLKTLTDGWQPAF